MFHELDTISPKKLREIQNERLRALIDRCYHDIPYYRDLFDKNGIKPKHIQTTDDLIHVPFTEKKDLRSLYPYEFPSNAFFDLLPLPVRRESLPWSGLLGRIGWKPSGNKWVESSMPWGFVGAT
jgi:hypothetical protein